MSEIHLTFVRQDPTCANVIMTAMAASGRLYQLHAPEWSSRWDGDPLAYSTMEITLEGKLVGRMHTGTYGSKYHASINPLRWAGPLPKDHYDNRYHDITPYDTPMQTLKHFVSNAEAFFEYRASLPKPTDRMHVVEIVQNSGDTKLSTTERCRDCRQPITDATYKLNTWKSPGSPDIHRSPYHVNHGPDITEPETTR